MRVKKNRRSSLWELFRPDSSVSIKENRQTKGNSHGIPSQYPDASTSSSCHSTETSHSSTHSYSQSAKEVFFCGISMASIGSQRSERVHCVPEEVMLDFFKDLSSLVWNECPGSKTTDYDDSPPLKEIEVPMSQSYEWQDSVDKYKSNGRITSSEEVDADQEQYVGRIVRVSPEPPTGYSVPIEDDLLFCCYFDQDSSFNHIIDIELPFDEQDENNLLLEPLEQDDNEVTRGARKLGVSQNATIIQAAARRMLARKYVKQLRRDLRNQEALSIQEDDQTVIYIWNFHEKQQDEVIIEVGLLDEFIETRLIENDVFNIVIEDSSDFEEDAFEEEVLTVDMSVAASSITMETPSDNEMSARFKDLEESFVQLQKEYNKLANIIEDDQEAHPGSLSQ